MLWNKNSYLFLGIISKLFTHSKVIIFKNKTYIKNKSLITI